MSRQEKGSRMRLLPAKLQLQQRDALTGSYPTNQRFSTDGRTGNYLTNFDDTKTIDFISVESEVLVTEQTYGFESDLIHYQRWSDDEYQGALQTELRFKQTYVGTPFSTEINQAIQDINNNDKNDDNHMIVQMAQFDSDPWPKPGPHPNTKALLFDKDNAEFAYIDYYQTDPGANYKDVTNRPFSVCVWIYPTIEDKEVEYPIVYQGMLNAAESIISPQSVWQLLIVDQRIEFRVYNEGNYNQYAYARTIDQIPSGEWIQVCVTYNPDGGNKAIFIYVNKAEQQLDTNYDAFTNGLICQYEQLVIGRYYYNDEVNPVIDNKYLGLISEIFYTGKILSQEEIEILDDAVRSGVSIIDYVESSTENVGGYIPGIGLSKSSIWLQQPDAQDILSLTGSSMYSNTGSVQPSVIDGLPFIHFSPGQDLTPFRDSSHPAVDGKSDNNPFYATGSAVTDVGEGFTSPLWSKNKIEIDISVANTCTSNFFISSGYYPTANASPSTQNQNYNMCYYNFENKTWEGLGLGYPFGFTSLTRPDVPLSLFNRNFIYDNSQTIGFSPGIVNFHGTLADFKTQVSGIFEFQASAGEPVTNFGFPYHPKFHATSSQLLNLSQYITEPFLLEKIVVELSAAYTVYADIYNTASYEVPSGITTITSITQSTLPCAINNFFILNQRSNNILSNYVETTGFSNSFFNTSLPTTKTLSFNGPNTYVTTVRDLITWGGISSFAQNMLTSSFRVGVGGNSSNGGNVYYIVSGTNVPFLSYSPKELMTRDYNISSSQEAHDDLRPLSWVKNVYMELPTKVATSINKIASNSTQGIYMSQMNFGNNTLLYQSFINLKYDGGGRNALGMAISNGRNYVSPVNALQFDKSAGEFDAGFNIGSIKLIKSENHYKYNPYILLPTDQLIFGWQQPMLNYTYISGSGVEHGGNQINIKSGLFSDISFLPGPAKVTLYGSYIREGKEYNEGTNQLLSSDSIHEVIE